MERRVPGSTPPIYLDTVVRVSNLTVAFELKYKTKLLDEYSQGEHFSLKNQGAQDQGKYDFLRDVERLERTVDSGEASVGYAIFLTNDGLYWKHSVRGETVDAEFRLHTGSEKQGTLSWSSKASDGTKRARACPIVLAGRYKLAWKKFSDLDTESSNRIFKYLVVKVGNAT
ncbi:MAG: hypothetical protein CL694_00655 [Chloroflexi bacterium]|jgi:hypothetical protein|nr:hypothetical protein [Chloroflexota bacterium]MDP6801501.1 hypothetical protein [SAR202 cluster bacterium]HAL46159.1 hypothetical protein [Dehalococcoidia bacterium]|tara:strand:+ start:1943 stop:2455 length:513 start_codon:yes stop_codon:yes gene_type:complete